MLHVSRAMYRETNMKIRRYYKKHSALSARLTHVRLLILCVLFPTHVEAFDLSADAAAGLTLGVADRHLSTCVYLVQSTPNQGKPRFVLLILFCFPSEF
jgi:hypothetical protein